MTLRLHMLCAAIASSGSEVSFPPDIPLDARAREAARALAGRLPRIDKAWSGPETGALETAKLAGLQPEINKQLRNCDFGRWTGQSLAQVQNAESGALSAWLEDPESAPHGGESFASLFHRVRVWMDELLPRTGSVMAVTYPAVIRAAVIIAIGAGPKARLHIDVAALTRVKITSDGKRWTLSALIPRNDPK